MQVESLSLTNNSHHLLSECTFSITTPQVVALLGAAGSGKSLLLRTIAGAIKSSSGEISFEGIKKKPADLKKEVATFPLEENILINEATVAELLHNNYLTKSKKRKSSKEQKEFTAAICATLHISEILEKPLFEISDSQLKLVMLAITFSQRKELIVLDNPDSALDPKAQIALVHLIKTVCSEEKTRIIIASHNLDFLFACSTQYIGLKNGEIIEKGKSRSVTSNALTNIYGHNIECNYHIKNSLPETYLFHEI